MLSTYEIAARAGLTYREVDYWTRCGVLVPEMVAHGSGTQRRYTDEESLVALVLRELRTLGAGLPVLAEVAGQLRQWSPNEWRGPVFVNSVGFVQRDMCSRCWVLDLDVLAREMASA